VLQIAGEHDGLVPLARQQAMVEQERKADGAGAPGADCGAGCTLYRGTANVKFLVHPGKHEYPSTIALETVEFFRTAGGPPATADGDAAKVAAGPKSDIVQYKSNGQDLMAFVYKPPGDGPFPVYMWNHGVERDPGPGALPARFFVPRGYIFFAPLRSGHGPNKGPWILDEQKAVADQRSPQGFKKLMATYERANEDTLAAYNWIARQSYVDPKRIIVAGVGQGAVQTLLLAERDRTDVLNIRCAVAFSPASESWANPHWAKRLETAVATARAPIFLLQANNDFSLGPSETLGPRIDARGGANRHKVYPNHGAAEDHVAGHAGFSIASNAWGDDMVEFLHACGAAPGP
jgi:dienelactone hydrolase